MKNEVTEKLLHLVVKQTLMFVDELATRPVRSMASSEQLVERLRRPLNQVGMAPEAVVKHLCGSVDDGLIAMPSGRFYGWVIGSALPSALAADWLTAAWGQNAALYATSPAAAVVEDVVGTWLKDLLTLPSEASFALVTGCQMAHTTCLAAARNALLKDRGWDVEARGLQGAPAICVISSNRRHASIDRAVRLLGLGMDFVRYLDPNEEEVLEPQVVEEALRAYGGDPTILLLQAGDINTGVFDRFQTLIPMAKRYGSWVHVDGAFGLWAAASSHYRELVAGVSAADSWATDGHKWLNVPFDCGYAFVRNAVAHRAAMSVTAPYITADTQLRDSIAWNPEWSRRARSFPTYAALLELGREGVAEIVERTCRYARAIVDGLSELPSVEVLWRPIINQGLVRFCDPRPDATEVDHDRRTEEVIQQVVASGEAFFTPTTWRAKRAMRISVLNWRTTEADVRRVIAAFRHVLLSG